MRSWNCEQKVDHRYGMAGPEDKLRMDNGKLRINVLRTLGTLLELRIRWKGICCLKESIPLSAEVCQTMLKMKLKDGKRNEIAKELLKRWNNQAGIRKVGSFSTILIDIRTGYPGANAHGEKTTQIRIKWLDTL
ncbi:hypothetical protein Tco_0406947 [Tanacetum coccineum]